MIHDLKGWKDYAYSAIPKENWMMRRLWLAGSLMTEAEKAGRRLSSAAGGELARIQVEQEDFALTPSPASRAYKD